MLNNLRSQDEEVTPPRCQLWIDLQEYFQQLDLYGISRKLLARHEVDEVHAAGLVLKRVAFKKVGRFSGHRATWRYHFRVGFVSTACWRAARTFVRATPKAGRGLVVTADIIF